MPRVRKSDTKKMKRSYNYEPPKLLEAPAPPPGMKYHWVRTETHGQPDASNFARRRRQGYVPVSKEELPEEFHAPTIEHGNFDGYVGVQGLVLCKIPEEKAEQIREYSEAKAARMEEAVRSNWMNDKDPHMPKSHDVRVKVTKGTES